MNVSKLISSLFAIAALINLAPVAGAVSGAALESAYGVTLADPNLVILMRHRALLFAVVGVLLLGAAFRPGWRPIATAAGLFSMVGFLLVLLVEGGASEKLQQVAVADAVGIVALVGGALLNRRAH